MKVLIQLVICSAFFLGVATAQHRGGGGGGGGFHGSVGGASHIGGGGVSSFGHGGLTGGGLGSGYRGGFGYGGLGYRGYGGYGYGCCGFGFGLGLGYYGYGYGYGYPYYGYPSYGYYDPYSYYPDSYNSYPAYQTAYPAYQPSTTVVYPPSQPAASYSYSGQAAPAMRGYDQYGQQMRPTGGNESGSPIYLIAMKNGNIYAAASYSVDGATLNYVTLDHAAKQAPASDIDRDLTMRLNGERHVAFQLPMQK